MTLNLIILSDGASSENTFGNLYFVLFYITANNCYS